MKINLEQMVPWVTRWGRQADGRRGFGDEPDVRRGVRAGGHAQRRCCLKLLDRVKRTFWIRPATLWADKGYDSEDFRVAQEEHGIEPHVSCKSRKEFDVPRACDQGEWASGRVGEWARWYNQQDQTDEAFTSSQRKLDEEVFGRCKSVGGLRWMRVTGPGGSSNSPTSPWPR